MGDSLWWAVVTITTIGYGDYYPVTVPGRWAAAALMVGGFAVLSMVTAAVSSWLVESVTAATSGRIKADNLSRDEELARLTAQINRLHDQLARSTNAIDITPEDGPAGQEPH
jgi:voltage-gated potassium channel